VRWPTTGTRNAAGRVELQAGDHSAGFTTRTSSRSVARVGHVAQQVGKRESLEGGVSEGQVLGPAQDQAYAAGVWAGGHVGLRGVQHLRVTSTPVTRAPVREANCRATPPGPVATSSTHPPGPTATALHHGLAPAAVLAERQHLGQAVVPRRKAVEELAAKRLGPVSCTSCSLGPGLD